MILRGRGRIGDIAQGLNQVLSIVVMATAILPLAVDIRVCKVRIASAFLQLGLQLRMGVGQVNDKDASVGRLVVAVVTMEESSLVRTLVRPKVLEVLADHVLAVTGVIEGDLFADATNEANGAVGGAVFAVGRGAASTTTVGRRSGGGQELLHVGLAVEKMLLHGNGLCFEDGRATAGQHLLVNFVHLDGDENVQGDAVSGQLFFQLFVLAG